MARDYIPRRDGDFDAWTLNFVSTSVKFWGNEGFDPPALAPLVAAQSAWNAAYAASVAAAAAFRAASAAKESARAEFERLSRLMAAYTQTYPAVTDATRAEMGLTVADSLRTPAAPPTTAPSISIAQPERLTHTLRLADESTPTRAARPRGTRGAEIWLALTTPGAATPTDPAAYRFLTLATKPLHRSSFTLSQQGLTAAYMLRWVNTRGEKGPWSSVATATVAA